MNDRQLCRIQRPPSGGLFFARYALADEQSPQEPRRASKTDGRCDPQGRFWAGTIYEPRDRRLGELFSVDAREGGKPTLALRAINNVVSNGLAWSPDGRTLYWADTQDHRIDAPRPSVTPLGEIPDPADADANFAQPWTYTDEEQLFGVVRA